MYENYESTETNSLMRYFQSVSWIAIKESQKKYEILRAFLASISRLQLKFKICKISFGRYTFDYTVVYNDSKYQIIA